MAAITQGKTWVNAETITHTALNASQANLVTAANDLAGQYKTLLVSSCWASTDLGAATYIIDTWASGSTAPAVSGASLSLTAVKPPKSIYFDDADAVTTTLAQKLRLRAQVNTNATAWSSVTATFGLYPVTFSGGADAFVVTLGTVVAGSTVAIANPGASTTSQGNSGDFTIPADGQYALGVVTSATLTNNAAALLTAQLQYRSV